MTRRACIPLLLWLGCGPSATPTPAPEPLPPGTPHRSTTDPLEAGRLDIVKHSLAEGESGAPVELRVHAPVAAGTYALVVFQHGFLSDVDWYDEILGHVASHGFVVVAPQMYVPDGIPLGKPTAADELVRAVDVVAWSRRSAGAVAGVATDPEPPGLAGHSRGGKVAWLEVLTGGVEARAIAGVDPVDGRGGPLGGQLPALDGPVTGTPPALVIGYALGPVSTGSFGACAPADDGFRHFFDDTAAPAWLYLVPGHGHGDMLDEETWRADGLCPSGPERAAVRRLTGGLLARFFRAHLQDDAASLVALSDAGGLPLAPTLEHRPAPAP